MLTDLQRQDMDERRHDVDKLVAILFHCDHREATSEDAYLAWTKWSDSAAASWLTITSDDEVCAAYSSLILDRIDTAARRAVEWRCGEVADFVRDYLGQNPVDSDETDLITISTIAPRGDEDEALGRLRRWSANDAGFVDALVDRFNIELPAGHARYARSHLLTAVGLSATTADGFAA